jgi:uncharacterized membrane protein YuzA (DUF378 family)
MATIVHPKSSTLTLFKLLTAIAIVGAINWGLIGLFNWNLVDAILGGGAREETSTASRIVYALVGLCGLGALPLLLSRHAESLPTTRGV